MGFDTLLGYAQPSTNSALTGSTAGAAISQAAAGNASIIGNFQTPATNSTAKGIAGMAGAISGLSSAYATIKQGQASDDAAQAQSKALMTQSNDTMQSALDQARLIRQQGQQVQGSARAAAAASGVSVGVGSAKLDADHIGNQANSDALATIATGSRQATTLQTDAQQVAAAGQARKQASMVSALAGGVSALTKWQTAPGATAYQNNWS